MSGGTEIYPYQRVSEPGLGQKRNRKNPSVLEKWFKSIFALQNIRFLEEIKGIATVDTLVISIIALVMSRAFVLVELLPFAFAFAAAFQYEKPSRFLPLALFTGLGFLIALSGVDLLINLLAIIALTAVIRYSPIPREKAWWGLPFLTISVLLVTKTIITLFSGFSVYNEMVIIFEALMAGILTFVFMIASEAVRERKVLVSFTFEEITAFMILGIGLVMGLNDFYIGQLSIASIISRLGVLVAAFLWGCATGTMVGVMAGIVPSISSSIFAQSLAIYAVSGLLAGLFKNFGRLGVVVGFMLGNLALSMFIPETQSTILGIWETGIAAVLFVLLPSSLKEKVPVQSLGTISNLSQSEYKRIDERIRDTARSRIENLAEIFEELSCTFTDENDLKTRIDQSGYLNYLYNEIMKGFCNSCSRYSRCWEQDCYNTSQKILDIFTMAETAGEVHYEQCPVEFRKSCVYGREIVNTINYLFDNLRINEYWAGKIGESRDLVARQLQGISHVVKNLAEEIDIKTMVDFQLRDKLLHQSDKLGTKIEEFIPLRTGNEELQLSILAESCADGKQCGLIAGSVSDLIGQRMQVCEKKCPSFPGKGKCEFTLSRAFNYRIQSGAAQVGKEEVCGDSFTIATLKEGKELIALSDGMGVGERALGESQAAVRLLKNLLDGGFNRETALKTINSVLLLRSTNESFATLDLAMIDLYSGNVDFIKIGSAPSYVKRGRQVEEVVSNSLPIGILNSIDIVTENRILCPRDMLVMLSDGVLEVFGNRRNDQWVREFLAAVDETDPNTLAELIINKALAICKGKVKDDMTVICLRIETND